jgi:hypothetical protein
MPFKPVPLCDNVLKSKAMHTNKTSFKDSAAKQQTSALWMVPTWQEKHLALTLAKYLSVSFVYSSFCYSWTCDPETKLYVTFYFCLEKHQRIRIL